MILRDADIADAPAIAAIWTHHISHGDVTFTCNEKSATDVAAMITTRRAAGQGFLVAEEQGRVLGFASYGPFRAGPGYRHTVENTVMLADEALGRGVGRALMQALLAQARAAGMHAMVAAISGTNAGGLAFHAALGFEQVARMPEVGWKGGKRLDLVLMQKLLKT